MKPELICIVAGCAAIGLAWLTSLFPAFAWRPLRAEPAWAGAGATATTAAGARRARPLWTWLLDAALAALALGLALRWQRLGHGPFLNLFEILASSLFSLGLGLRLTQALRPVLAPIAPVVLAVLAVMALWLAVGEAPDTHLPATYQTPVLWFHVGLGKVFLACTLVATGLAGVVLLRHAAWSRAWGAARFAALPADGVLDAWAWRFMSAALVFESLMLIAGAVWAQDAWGRYWAWDPLETWAFVTWLALAFAIHARLTWRVSARASAAMIVAVFVIAFLTFFGMPFVSTAPHKGAV